MADSTPETWSAEALGIELIDWLELEITGLRALYAAMRDEVSELSTIVRGWEAARTEDES